jgi:uncharacterized short protein YbdD (DUF466 family)
VINAGHGSWVVGRGPLRRVARVIRRIAGMPDYEAYVEHLRTCHPERQIPTEREYLDEFLKRKYDGGPNRCC